MSDNKKEKHLRAKLTLKVVGIILLTAGLGFIIVGITDFVSTFGKPDMPKHFWCLFVGFPLFAIGIVITLLGFKKEITTYIKNESVPVINEIGQEIKPAVSAISNAVKDGMEEKVICECGTQNEQGSKFCSNCGKSLIVLCPNCGAKINSNNKFCNNCGKNSMNPTER